MASTVAIRRLVSANLNSTCLCSVSSATTIAPRHFDDNLKAKACCSDTSLRSRRDFSSSPDRANAVLCSPSVISRLLQPSHAKGSAFRLMPPSPVHFQSLLRLSVGSAARKSCETLRYFSHGSVSLVISPDGHPKFETHEVDPPKKYKFMTKKRFKMQKKREKQKRKAANKTDPRRLTVKGTKKNQKFATAEDRLKYKLEKAKIKEARLIERLKRYEVAKVQGPVVKPHYLTGEERFYMKKMAQKRSNYVPIGRRGIFGGVILNMHMHWKKHETVKVISNSSKPGQIQEFAEEIARLSGGIPIQIIGRDTVVFYRGKDYEQPKVMSPVDTLSKKRALEKSKYEQSLESVRRFIAITEKELELYYRHAALCEEPNKRNSLAILDNPKTREGQHSRVEFTEKDNHSTQEVHTSDQELSESDELSDFDDDDFEDDDDLEESTREELCHFNDNHMDYEDPSLKWIATKE